MEITSTQFIRGVIGSHNLIVDEKPQIAFVGRSNVGKSSVINMLVGQKNLVQTSAKPGKTQQINFFLINDRMYFVDLPGYGYAKASIKKREKLRRLILWYFISGEASVALVFIIIDAQVGLRDFDREMIAVLKEYKYPFALIVNKVDKLNQKALHASLVAVAQEAGSVPIVSCSARKGRGKSEILRMISERIE